MKDVECFKCHRKKAKSEEDANLEVTWNFDGWKPGKDSFLQWNLRFPAPPALGLGLRIVVLIVRPFFVWGRSWIGGFCAACTDYYTSISHGAPWRLGERWNRDIWCTCGCNLGCWRWGRWSFSEYNFIQLVQCILLFVYHPSVSGLRFSFLSFFLFSVSSSNLCTYCIST